MAAHTALADAAIKRHDPQQATGGRKIPCLWPVCAGVGELVLRCKTRGKISVAFAFVTAAAWHSVDRGRLAEAVSVTDCAGACSQVGPLQRLAGCWGVGRAKSNSDVGSGLLSSIADAT